MRFASVGQVSFSMLAGLRFPFGMWTTSIARSSRSCSAFGKMSAPSHAHITAERPPMQPFTSTTFAAFCGSSFATRMKSADSMDGFEKPMVMKPILPSPAGSPFASRGTMPAASFK